MPLARDCVSGVGIHHYDQYFIMPVAIMLVWKHVDMI
jgi:hypothetical protein